jgi:hypothetical protein
MIDLAPAYHRAAELLAQYGLGDRPYALTAEIWNLRTSTPRVTFNLAVQAAPHETFGAFQKATPEAAVAELERMLQARGPVPTQYTPTADLRVTTP